MKKSFVKEGVLRLLVVMFAMMVILGNFSFSVSAGNAKKYYSLPLGGEFKSFEVHSGDAYHYHSFDLPSDGYFTYYSVNDSAQGRNGWIWLNVVDSETSTSSYSGFSISPHDSGLSKTVALSKGRYLIKVSEFGNGGGSYQLKASFTPANNNEAEPNNYFNNAMELPINTEITGFICSNDEDDYYKVNLSSPQTIRLYYSSPKDLNFYINDVNYIEKWHDSYSNGEKFADQYLPAGTNYIVVKRNDYTTYKIKWTTAPTPAESVSITGSGEVAVGSTVGLTANVLPVDTTDKSVTWSSSNTNIASVDGNGIVRGINVGIARIYAVTNDGSNKTAEFDIVVKPKTIEKVKAKSKGRKNVKVSWKKHKSVSDYQIQFCKNKKFKSGVKTRKVNGYELKNAEVRAPKKGTFYVRVRGNYYANGKTYHGDWSKPVKVKVK